MLVGLALWVKQVVIAFLGAIIAVVAVVGDVAAAAFIAGMFTILNTYLTAMLHRKLNQVRETNKESTQSLVELAKENRKEKDELQGS